MGSPNMAVAKLALFLVASLSSIGNTKSENTFVIAPIPGNLLAKFQDGDKVENKEDDGADMEASDGSDYAFSDITYKGQRLCPRVAVYNADYADCNGDYAMTDGTVSWAPDRRVYAHPCKNRYIFSNFWNDGPGWSIGSKNSLKSRGFFHRSWYGGKEPWTSPWQKGVVVKCIHESDLPDSGTVRTTSGQPLCPRVVVHNADYADCNGEYDLSQFVSFAPDR